MVPNHLNTFVHTTNNKNAIIKVVKLPSLIADQLFSAAASIDSNRVAQFLRSSIILSYIRTFASTHIPIDNKIAAIQLREYAYHINFVTHNKTVRYDSNVRTATEDFLIP